MSTWQEADRRAPGLFQVAARYVSTFVGLDGCGIALPAILPQKSGLSKTLRRSGPAAFLVISQAGLAAGILDLAFAILYTAYRGGSALGVLRFIAGGVLGPSALKGGGSVAWLGLLLHFVIALGAAAVFYGTSRVVPWLHRRPVLSGFFFGVAVWLVMNLVVLRFSAWHVTAFPPPGWFPIFFAHLVCVGLPIALVTAAHAAREGDHQPWTG